MSGLQAEHGRNVFSALAKGRPVCRRNPDQAECLEFSWAGSEAGSCGGMHANWVENRTSTAFSCPISRNHVGLELCGMDFSISVQVEHAMFWSDQGVSGRRVEQDQAGVPAACKTELATTRDGAGRDVGMAFNSARCGGSSGLKSVPNLCCFPSRLPLSPLLVL